jgi:hypothetical protein
MQAALYYVFAGYYFSTEIPVAGLHKMLSC